MKSRLNAAIWSFYAHALGFFDLTIALKILNAQELSQMRNC
jgi:hypothetical protein